MDYQHKYTIASFPKQLFYSELARGSRFQEGQTKLYKDGLKESQKDLQYSINWLRRPCSQQTCQGLEYFPRDQKLQEETTGVDQLQTRGQDEKESKPCD